MYFLVFLYHNLNRYLALVKFCPEIVKYDLLYLSPSLYMRQKNSHGCELLDPTTYCTVNVINVVNVVNVHRLIIKV